jgi:hypothetical protein
MAVLNKLVLCLALVGCSSDDSGGGGNGSIAVENLGLELAVASCAQQFGCCTDAEIMAQYMGITFEGQPIETEAQCVDFANAVFTSFGVMAYQSSIAMGRAEYDGEAAADCVALIEDLSCEQYGARQLPASGCTPWILPKVADGGACTQDYECLSDNCVGERTPLGEPSTDGACMPMPTEGQDCDDNCATGLYCDSDLDGTTCKPLVTNGGDCTFDDDCASDYCDDATDTCAARPLTCDGR